MCVYIYVYLCLYMYNYQLHISKEPTRAKVLGFLGHICPGEAPEERSSGSRPRVGRSSRGIRGSVLGIVW